MESIRQEKVLKYIHQFVEANRLPFDIDKIEVETDLVFIGMDSMSILSLLAEIESSLKISISLEALEECNFIVSAQTIAYNLTSSNN